jgi:hypothetical protein
LARGRHCSVDDRQVVRLNDKGERYYETFQRGRQGNQRTNAKRSSDYRGDANVLCLYINGRFIYVPMRKREGEKQHCICPLHDDKRRRPREPAISQTVGDFKKNFEIFTNNTSKNLDGLDWKDMVAAKDSVIACLLHGFSHRGFPCSNVDLFFYGPTEEQVSSEVFDIGRVLSCKSQRQHTFLTN